MQTEHRTTPGLEVRSLDPATSQAFDGASGAPGWRWIDLHLTAPDGADEARRLLQQQDFDALAIDDAVADVDLPKVDDFGDHLVIVMHGLRPDSHGTYELDCFVTEHAVITVRSEAAPALDVLWERLQERGVHLPESPGELVARLVDLIGRGLQSVVEAFDDRIEELVEQALRADDDFLEDLMAVRRIVRPQREALATLRSSDSELLSAAAVRRFADVYDMANRTSGGLDAARASLAETLDSYRGAEARRATDVTMVLTVYAAVVLPLSLIAGIFGMNVDGLPWAERPNGWLPVLALMTVVAAGSLLVFLRLGWISLRRRPQGVTRGLTGVVRSRSDLAAVAAMRPFRRTRKRQARRRTS